MKVAIYARVANMEQTTEHQIEELKKHCHSKGWSVYKAFADEGVSGITLNRPKLNEMMTEIKSGKIDKVFVMSLDRLSRSMTDTLFLINEFKANNTDFEILKG